MKKISTVNANPLVINGIALGIAVFAYIAIYKGIWHISPPEWAKGIGFVFLIVLAVSLLLLHEIIHMTLANILVRGVGATLHIRLLVWECRLKKPLKKNQYIAYALAPGIVITAAALFLHYLSNSANIRFMTAISFVAGLSSAAGDYFLVAKILKFPGNSSVIDNGISMDIVVPEDED